MSCFGARPVIRSAAPSRPPIRLAAYCVVTGSYVILYRWTYGLPRRIDQPKVRGCLFLQTTGRD
jgi:hypothetical protein